MKYYIGADLGTSALKLLLIDNSGKIVKTASRSYSVYYPEAGWSEQNPEDWWEAFLSGIKELVQNIDTSKVAGIGARRLLQVRGTTQRRQSARAL